MLMRYYARLLCLLLLVGVYSGCAVPAAHSYGAETRVDLSPPDVFVQPEDMANYYLENGLEVVAIRNAASPMVGLNLVVQVGSAYEDYRTSGMSHMLEHLLFNGTTKRTQAELYAEVDRLGVYSNAHTDKYFTNYILLFPADKLDASMDVQTDMVFNSILPKGKFDKERGIVNEEIRQGRDRTGTERDKYFDRVNYGPTGVGLPTLGTISTITNLSRDVTYEFYKKHYVPNNMVLIVVGNFEPDALRKMLEKHYGVWAPGPVEPLVGVSPDIKNGHVNQTRGDTKKAHGQIVFEAPAFGETGQPAYEILATMFNKRAGSGGHGPGDGLAVTYSAQPHVGRLIFSFSEDDEAAANAAIAGHIATIKAFAANLGSVITDQELARMAKEQRVENAGLLDSPHYFGMFKAGDAALGGGTELLRRLWTMETAKAAQLIDQLKDFERKPHYFNIYAPQQWTVTDTTENMTGTTKSVLTSGAVLISKTSGGSPMFGMHLLIKNRYVIEDSLAGGAELLHGLLTSGTSQYTAEQIKARIAELGITLKTQDMGFIPYDDYYNSPDYGYIRLECLTEDAPEAIRFLAHLMSDASQITEEQVKAATAGAKGRVAQQSSTARHTAKVTYNGLLLGDSHPSIKLVSGTTQSLDRINVENLAQLREAYFKPSNYIVTVSSSMTQDELVNLFNSLWPGTGEPVKRVIPQIATATRAQEKTIDLGKEQAQIRLGYIFEIADKDKAAFNLAVRILSDRMQFDLREQQGLAYRLGVSVSYEGNTGWITARIGTGVQNIDKVVSALKGYLQASKIADISEDDIIQLANAERGRYMRRNLTRVGQAYYLGYYEYYSGDYTKAEQVGSAEAIPSLKEVKAAVKKYLKLPQNYTLVVVR